MILCEKRDVKRCDIFLIAECRPVNLSKEFSVGITRNLSTDGFSIETQSFDRACGDILEFTLKHPHNDLAVTVTGKVIWKNYSWYKYVVGVQYFKLSEEKTAQIEGLLNAVRDEINMNEVCLSEAVNGGPDRDEEYSIGARDVDLSIDCLSVKNAPSPMNELMMDEEDQSNVHDPEREHEKEVISTFQQRTDKVYGELMKRLPKERAKKTEKNDPKVQMNAPRKMSASPAQNAPSVQKVMNRKIIPSVKKEHLPEKATVFLGAETVVLPVPKLVIVAGRDTGKEFLLDKDQLCIGRSGDNNIVLNDPMVSRKHHARVVRNEDTSWMIEDLRSTNGIYVGKKKVVKSLLSSGSEVKIGATIFRYVESVEDFAPATRGREIKHKIRVRIRVPKLVYIAVPALLVLLGALFAVPGINENVTRKTGNPFFKGEKAQKENHMNIRPDRGRPFPGSKALTGAVDDRARNSVDDYQNAVAARGTEEKSGSLRHKAEEEYLLDQRKQADAHVAEGKEMVENKNYREAIEKFHTALNLDSENEEAKALIEKTNKEYKRSVVQKSKKRKDNTQSKLDVALITNAIDVYSEGDVDKAISILRVIRMASDSREQARLAEAYIGAIKRVENSYWKGSELYNAKNTAEAFREWTKTLTYEKELPLKDMSWHSRKIAGLAALERYTQ